MIHRETAKSLISNKRSIIPILLLINPKEVYPSVCKVMVYMKSEPAVKEIL